MPDTAAASRSFRLSMPFVLAYTAAANTAIIGLFVLAAWLAGRRLEPVYLVTLWAMPFAYWVVLALTFRLTVSPCSLGWVNRSGVRCELAWSDIVKAERKSQCGFPNLVVTSTRAGLDYQINFCLTDVEGFRDAVRDVVGDEHLVAVAVA